MSLSSSKKILRFSKISDSGLVVVISELLMNFILFSEKMVSLILQCHVPPIHGVLFSVGVSDKKAGAMSEADISHEVPFERRQLSFCSLSLFLSLVFQASTDVLLLRVDRSRVCTTVTHSSVRIQFIDLSIFLTIFI